MLQQQSVAAMELPRSKGMASSSWLLFFSLAAGVVFQARAQLDSIGFISIDCGLPGTTSYVDDDATTLSFVPDAAFTDAGENRNISAEHITPQLARKYHNVRSFPDGARNCYTLRFLIAGNKYLLRATFMYGNYDGLNRPPVFDLHIGVNFWKTVNVSGPDTRASPEAIVVVPDSFVQVCLINTGSGTPFISGLSLRPLKSSLYPQVNETQGLVLLSRRNYGQTDDIVVRYPDDPHDRIWKPRFDDTIWYGVSTAKRVLNEDKFEAPSKVMQTAITPRNASGNIELSWNSMTQLKDQSSPGYIAIMHFSELNLPTSNDVREFYINLNGELWRNVSLRPVYLQSEVIYGVNPLRGYTQYDVSINATANSTLPPIINAIEIFSVISTNKVGTDSQDASAMMAIKAKYQVKKNWMGDPCVAEAYVWDGLMCTYAIPSPPRVTGVVIVATCLADLPNNLNFYY